MAETLEKIASKLEFKLVEGVLFCQGRLCVLDVPEPTKSLLGEDDNFFWVFVSEVY